MMRPTIRALTADAHDILAFADLRQHRLIPLAQSLLPLVYDLLRATSQRVRDIHETAQLFHRERAEDPSNGVYREYV